MSRSGCAQSMETLHRWRAAIRLASDKHQSGCSQDRVRQHTGGCGQGRMRQHTGGCAKGRMRQHTGECTQSSMRNYTGGQLQLNDLIQMPFACICSLFKLQSRLWAKRLLQSKAFTSRPMPPHEIGCSPMLLTSSFSPAACTMPASDVAYLQHQIPILSSSKC
eukprot:scaffold99459_cov23-Tisochrysis_lutea.AAC.1